MADIALPGGTPPQS